MREVGETLSPGSAALCLLLREATPDRLIERLRDHAPHARLLRTNLSHTDEDRLRQMLEQASRQARSLRLVLSLCFGFTRKLQPRWRSSWFTGFTRSPGMSSAISSAETLIDGRSLQQGAEKIGPEAHQGGLALGHQTERLQVGCTALEQPETSVVMTGLGPHGQTGCQGFGAGLTAAAPQAGRHQQPAGVDGGDSIAAAQVGEGEPVALREGLGVVVAGHGPISRMSNPGQRPKESQFVNRKPLQRVTELTILHEQDQVDGRPQPALQRR